MKVRQSHRDFRQAIDAMAPYRGCCVAALGWKDRRIASVEMRLTWIRHLPSIIASSLLFGFIGTPLGTVAFFVIAHGTADKPPSYRGFDEFLIGPGFVIAVIAGAVPAFVTGIVSGILRIYIRALWLLTCVMAPVGAVVTALYIELMFGWHGVPEQSEVILTGGIAAFLCTFLLWRNRPWLIPPR